MSYNGSSHDAYWERQLESRGLDLREREVKIKEDLLAQFAELAVLIRASITKIVTP